MSVSFLILTYIALAIFTFMAFIMAAVLIPKFADVKNDDFIMFAASGAVVWPLVAVTAIAYLFGLLLYRLSIAMAENIKKRTTFIRNFSRMFRRK